MTTNKVTVFSVVMATTSACLTGGAVGLLAAASVGILGSIIGREVKEIIKDCTDHPQNPMIQSLSTIIGIFTSIEFQYLFGIETGLFPLAAGIRLYAINLGLTLILTGLWLAALALGTSDCRFT